MREHKYRAYHKSLKKMQQVLAVELDPELGGVEVWGKASVDFSTGEHEATRDFWTWDEIELMEFTGTPDKNGARIFEGDILQGKGKYWWVEWSNKYSRWSLVTKNLYPERTRYSVMIKGLQYATDRLDVVGNRYEHAHLLEVSA